MAFVNRDVELRALESWWGRSGSLMGLVWGRRRVGKTALLQQFARGRRVVFHTAGGRPIYDELAALSRAAAHVTSGFRDLASRPFSDWSDALETLAGEARTEPLLVVLDEFPELIRVIPELPSTIRALWDRLRSRSKLRVLVCGSAVRTMEVIQEERSPLYGRLDLSLSVHPFRPHEAALMLPRLAPSDRALVWGIVGGVPLYLEWWDQSKGIRENLRDLVCSPGGLLLTEGELVLATEGESGELARQVLYAIAAGRTKHHEIENAVRADPARTLERLVELRLLDRLYPVTEDPRRTRRRIYRIADNFLAFWLGIVDRYRAEILRGLGNSILTVLLTELDDHMGPRWEEAFRIHLRRLADLGQIAPQVVAVGPFWTAAKDPVEIDAVVLAGRRREAVLVGEAKWTKKLDATRVVKALERKAHSLPAVNDALRYAVAAREEVVYGTDVLRATARDIFS